MFSVVDRFLFFCCLPEPGTSQPDQTGVSFPVTLCTKTNPLSSNGDLNLDTGVDVDNDLLDDLSGGVKAVVRQLVQDPRDKFEHSSRGGTYSIRRLWMRISKQSQVLEPSPQGVLRVVILRVLVGRRTGPLARRSLFLARSMISVQTFSRTWTLREERVMRILWLFCIGGLVGRGISNFANRLPGGGGRGSG